MLCLEVHVLLAIYLTWTAGDILEVVLTMIMITVACGIFAAVPFIAEHFVDDRGNPSE
jgi:F0F1-type ATP synthase assembly protein I